MAHLDGGEGERGRQEVQLAQVAVGGRAQLAAQGARQAAEEVDACAGGPASQGIGLKTKVPARLPKESMPVPGLWGVRAQGLGSRA